MRLGVIFLAPTSLAAALSSNRHTIHSRYETPAINAHERRGLITLTIFPSVLDLVEGIFSPTFSLPPTESHLSSHSASNLTPLPPIAGVTDAAAHQSVPVA